MKVMLYGNGGSGNHGCEAIVRGTYNLIQEPLLISSEAVEEDKEYGLDKFGDVFYAKGGKINKLQLVKAYAKLKLMGNYTDMDVLPYLYTIKKIGSKADIALSVGGDNYCYSNQLFYASLNCAYRRNGIKTVLWGCSIEPEVVRREKVSEDLKSYSLIVARESITYNALKEISSNVLLAPDPAFYMCPQRCQLDERFDDGNVVGINISPMIMSNENHDGITYENYKNLVSYILNYTNMKVALIPHVVWAKNDDRSVLQDLYNDFSQDQRLIFVDDHNAPELKYIISKCRFFVAARTHASIAAYSTLVPTLVVGYSIKARGIARDLFGTSENYVIPVQSMERGEQLTEAFRWLESNETAIRSHLAQFIPEYTRNGQKIKAVLERL